MLDDSKPKYVNSPETLVYHKSDTVFALQIAKRSASRRYVLCEGYMDVISMHQAGFDSAVATLGTAITATQARLIGRMGKSEVILSYDSDGPGQKAASRGINLLSSDFFFCREISLSTAYLTVSAGTLAVSAAFEM